MSIDAHKQVQGVITQEDVAQQFSQQLTEELDSSVDQFAPLQPENVVRVLKGRAPPRRSRPSAGMPVRGLAASPPLAWAH